VTAVFFEQGFVYENQIFLPIQFENGSFGMFCTDAQFQTHEVCGGYSSIEDAIAAVKAQHDDWRQEYEAETGERVEYEFEAVAA
jgi:hypothetical protein